MTTTAVAPWRLFDVEVRRVRALSPSFLRVTFTGPDLDRFADNGYDQRIKLVLPLPGRGLADLPSGPDWYPRWRALPEERRNPVRTYTVRYVRQSVREVDVDLVRHGGGPGPAARWVEAVRPGDPAALVGPDAGYPGGHGGVEFRPPAGSATVLLAVDETAVPAAGAILERLPAGARGEALLEVPSPEDALPAGAFAADPPPGMRVHWLPRRGEPYGSRLVPAVKAAAERLLGDGVRLTARTTPVCTVEGQVPLLPAGPGSSDEQPSERSPMRAVARPRTDTNRAVSGGGSIGAEPRSVVVVGGRRLRAGAELA